MRCDVQAQLLRQGASCCGVDGEAADGEVVALQLQLPQQPQPAVADGVAVTRPQLPRQPQPAAADGAVETLLLPQVLLCFPDSAPTCVTVTVMSLREDARHAALIHHCCRP